jgi:aryl-alcohol dehydrogenase-like predicted oxidoreductase
LRADAGINFFDCAEGYAAGESEKVMGRAIQHFGWNRNDIVVSTKVRLFPLQCDVWRADLTCEDLLGRAQLRPQRHTRQSQ